MISITIDSSTVEHEFPIEFIEDGTEEFDIGTLKIVGTSQREAYEDFADVVLTINGVDYEACIQKDISIRTAPNVYDHTIILVEPTIKLSFYKMADRLYTTKSGAVITYEDQLDNILLTHNFGKTSPLTIVTATATALDVDAVEKEYTGGDLLVTLTDMFRSINAVPTLNLDNEIGHKPFGELGTLRTLGDIIGEELTSDIASYGLGVYSKIKSGTYEKEEAIGYTYFPSKDSGVTVRSEDTKYDDTTAVFILDSGIRRCQATIMNLEVDTGGGSVFIEADISDYIVSKEEWDQLIVERNVTTLRAGVYKNNTIYFDEGDYIVSNFGIKYTNNNSTSTGVLVQEEMIDAWLTNNGYLTTDWVPQLVREMEVQFYYQSMRDMDARVERHNIDRVTKNATVSSNQKDSKLELSRYGNALKSQINRIGNDSYEVTKTYNNLAPFTLWELNDYTSDGFKVIKRHMMIRNNSLDVRYLFVKNASILDPMTAVNRSISPFTITKRNILSCFVYNEYFEISTTSRTDTGQLSSLGRRALLNGLHWNATYDTPIYNAQYYSTSSSSVKLNMSSTHYPMGETMVFNVSFKHPKFAGYQLVDETTPFTSGQRLVPISYGDANGEVNTFNLGYYNNLASTGTTFPVGTTGSNALITSQTFSVGLNPNEMLGVSYHIHAITNNENIIIGDYFTENNSLVQLLGGAQGTTLSRWAGTVKYNIYDKFKKSGSTGTGSYIVETTAYKQISINGVSAGETWAIHETASPYRLYLACNYDGTDYTVLYFNDLEDRPNTETL